MLISHDFDTEYSIIYPFDCSDSVYFAVKELKNYLFKITGAFLPEYADNRLVSNQEIIIGYTNRGGFSEAEKRELGDEGFIIRNIEDKIFIIGSDIRGALYGVYSFLEEYCGCRFYTRDFEKIPQNRMLEIDNFDDNKQIPQYFYRNSYWYPVATPEISAKLKINGCHGRNARFPKHLGGDVNYEGGFEHTIGWLSGQCPFGERAWTQPCLSDENVYNTVVGNVQSLLNVAPDAKLISITQNDGDSGPCQCDKCKAINEIEESNMGSMLNFVNRVAEHFEKDYPNLKFDTFAYRFTRKPPKNLRPRNNVIIRLCSIECCFRHPLSECNETPGHDLNGPSFQEDLLEWTKIAPNMTVWNYTTNFTNFSTFFCNFQTLRKNENFFAEHGMKGSFEQGNFASPNGEFGELRGYLLARLTWNPKMTEDEYDSYFNEFCEDYYGKGGKYIAEYIHNAEELTKDVHFGIYYDNSTDYIRCPSENVIDGKKQFIKMGSELFDKAESEAETPEQIAHIQSSRIQLLDYIDFTIREEIVSANESDKERLQSELLKNAELRFRYMRKYGIRCNREFNYIEKVSNPDLNQHVLLWNAPEN